MIEAGRGGAGSTDRIRRLEERVQRIEQRSGKPAYNLRDLADVNVGKATDGAVIVYDKDSGQWLPFGGAVDLPATGLSSIVTQVSETVSINGDGQTIPIGSMDHNVLPGHPFNYPYPDRRIEIGRMAPGAYQVGVSIYFTGPTGMSFPVTVSINADDQGSAYPLLEHDFQWPGDRGKYMANALTTFIIGLRDHPTYLSLHAQTFPPGNTAPVNVGWGNGIVWAAILTPYPNWYDIH